jgi:imidazolonepropionase-like amidohydrolase
VVIDGTTIASLGKTAPDVATIIDAQGGMLLPGLIDAHVHTKIEQLK